MSLAALTERLSQANLGDPAVVRAVLEAPEAQQALATLASGSTDPVELVRALLGQQASPHRPVLLAALAQSTGLLALFFEAARAWLELYSADTIEAAGERYKIAVQVTQDDGQPTPEAAAGELERELQRRMGDLSAKLETILSQITPSNPRLPWEGGASELDLAFVGVLGTLGNEGKRRGASLQERATTTGTAFQAGEATLADYFRLWLPSEKGSGARFALHLARSAWQDVVQPRFKAVSLGASIVSVRRGNDEYAKLSKLAPPMSWGWGASGVPAATVINGDHYAPTPKLIEEAALLPKTWVLLPTDHRRRPHQTALPQKNTPSPPPAAEVDETEALPLAMSNSQGYVVSTGAAKLALLLLASPKVRGGQLAKSTLGELTRLTRPDLQRVRARDHEATARGLDELRGLFVFLPDGTKVQVFDVQSPSQAEQASPEMLLHYGLTGTFVRTLAMVNEGDLKGPYLQGQEYRGEFLLNLTGAMRLPNNQPTLLRYYVRFAAHWNAAFGPGGTFDEGKMPAHTLEDWAAIANALPPGVVEYLASKKAGGDVPDQRRQLSNERKRTREDFEALAEEHRLLRLEKRGELWRPLPPSEYHEAWKVFRTHGGRAGEY